MNSLVELIIDLKNTGGKSFTFGVTNFYLLEFSELPDSASQVHDVLTSFKEAIKSHEKGVCSNLPLVLGLSLVIEVGIFEFVADFDGKSKLIMGFFCLSTLNKTKYLFSVDLASALIDDSIAYLSNQDYESRGSVVMLGIVPNKQDCVQDWNK
jgi:hypothetical protein